MPAPDAHRAVDQILPPAAGSPLQTRRCDDRTAVTRNDALWWVRRGRVRLHRLGRRPVLIDVFGPGSVASLSPVGEVREMLTADPGTEILEVELSRLAELAREHPEIAARLTLAMDRHRSLLRERLALRHRGRVMDQLVAGLDLLAHEVGAPCVHGHAGSLDLLGLSHQDIADLIGSSRPYVTSSLARLQRDGWVRVSAPRLLCLGAAVRMLP